MPLYCENDLNCRQILSGRFSQKILDLLPMDLVTLAAVIYGILAAAGGVLGYLKARSQMSLISGLVSGLLLIGSGVAHQQGASWGQRIAIGITVALLLVFGMRFYKTGKFMPAGLMVLAGLLTLVGLIL
jgi:uncharacterized membrane protein (UPF0136 family)